MKLPVWFLITKLNTDFVSKFQNRIRNNEIPMLLPITNLRTDYRIEYRLFDYLQMDYFTVDSNRCVCT